jgi:hypothetical protein
MSEVTIPEGYWTNPIGHLIPVDAISELDKDRNALVLELFAKVKTVSSGLSKLKADVMADVGAFVDLSAEKYGAKYGGKGNVTLSSFDGKYRIQRAVADSIVFDERIHAAKALIDTCIREWSQGSSSNIKTLIDGAFDVDKEGNINTSRIFSLMRLSIDDDNWRNAMNALKDSIQVTGSKQYIRVYERNDAGDYILIPLDISAA